MLLGHSSLHILFSPTDITSWSRFMILPCGTMFLFQNYKQQSILEPLRHFPSNQSPIKWYWGCLILLYGQLIEMLNLFPT
jgi:hypothetical protein